MKGIIVLGALIAISPGFAHVVRVDFDHGAHFSSYKTYRWVPSTEKQSSPGSFPSQLMEQRIARFIEEALACRGYRRVTTGGDLLVSYHVTVAEQPQYATFSDWSTPPVGYWGWGWAWSPWVGGYSNTVVDILYEGTLVIDVVDANKSKLVFEGTSTQAVSSRPKKNTEKLAKAVNRIMEKFPPQP